ncbi:hypothetical protein SLS58_011073 [Diplodia intermedia]|uniref:Uncharacterized protein n=1 Tax=Diplodia intermedia TaxID=856260 RepID=A0ABR3T2B7_9PEZI
MSLPSWVTNPARNFAAGEADGHHRARLDMLMVLRCTPILVAISAAEATLRCCRSGPPSRDADTLLSTQWQVIVSRAHETVPVMQNWKPNYFEWVDPMCAYSAFLVGSVLVASGSVADEAGFRCGAAEARGPVSCSPHVDLMMVFLRRVGDYWGIDTLRDLQQDPDLPRTYEEAIRFTAQATDPLNQPTRRSARGTVRSITTLERGGCSDIADVSTLEDPGLIDDGTALSMPHDFDFCMLDSGWLDEVGSSLVDDDLGMDAAYPFT